MMTDRDRKVVKAVGDHRALTREQIQYLFFPSEYTTWRRISKELQPNKYLSDEFRMGINGRGKSKKVYRLDKEGKKLYQELTGERYKTPRWNYNYIPHLLETNWLLIKLGIKDFELEYKIDHVKMDAYFDNIAVEVDLSESETRKEIMSKIKNYEKIYKYRKIPQKIIWYSNRAKKLKEWIGKTNISCLYVRRKHESVEKLKSAI